MSETDRRITLAQTCEVAASRTIARPVGSSYTHVISEPNGTIQ